MVLAEILFAVAFAANLGLVVYVLPSVLTDANEAIRRIAKSLTEQLLKRPKSKEVADASN